MAHGSDVKDIGDLTKAVSENIKGVKFFVVEADEIDEIEKIARSDHIAFKGTMNTHHVIWRSNSTSLRMNSLTCLGCVKGSEHECEKYSLGEYFFISRAELAENQKKIQDDARKNGSQDVIRKRGRHLKRRPEGGDEQIEIPKKRGRGRPRKQESQENEKGNVLPAKNARKNESEVLTPLKRGKPPKRKQEKDAEKHVCIPKKRGRPPKQRAQENENEIREKTKEKRGTEAEEF